MFYMFVFDLTNYGVLLLYSVIMVYFCVVFLAKIIRFGLLLCNNDKVPARMRGLFAGVMYFDVVCDCYQEIIYHFVTLTK